MMRSSLSNVVVAQVAEGRELLGDGLAPFDALVERHCFAFGVGDTKKRGCFHDDQDLTIGRTADELDRHAGVVLQAFNR